MKKALFLYLIFFAAIIPIVRAQYYTNQNKVWAFGSHAGLNFNTGSPVPFYSAISTNEGCASVCNSSGSLLFYTDGKNVYNSSGSMMPHGSSIVSFGTSSTSQAAVIAPVIGSATQYYLFSLEYLGGTGTCHLAYCIVDMSLASGSGDVVLSTLGTPLGSSFSEKMVAVPGNSCNIWLITHRKDSAVFWAYEINAAGFNTTPVVSSVGSLTGAGSHGIGMLKVSPDRSKIVSQTYTGGHSTELFDFNASTGVVSNCQVLESTICQYGAEFSPDNSKLYANQFCSNNIAQYDITGSTTSAIIASKTIIGSGSTFGDLRLGPDSKIYAASSGATNLAVITNPNGAGSTCGYTTGSVALSSGSSSVFGLPNVFYFLTPNDTESTHNDTIGCISIGGSISIVAHDSGAIGCGYLWDDGTTTRTRTVTAAGTYLAKIYDGCHLIIDTIHVTAYPAIGAITGSNNICVGSTTLMSDTSSGVWSISSAAATIGSSSGLVTGVSPGFDTVRYTNSVGCLVTKVITVNSLPGVITGPSAVCAGSLANMVDTPSGTWSSAVSHISIGSSTGTVTGISAGAAPITYTSSAGCIRTGGITVNPLPATIAGTTNVCVGATTSLANASPGGVWSSSASSYASVGSASGVVTGLVPGFSNVSYTLPTGCQTSVLVTINALPLPPTGGLDVCIGATSWLYSSPAGGSWIGGGTGISVSSPGGFVTGVTAGTALISYVLPTGCVSTAVVTVEPLPAAIGGPLAICSGATSGLSDATVAGYWTSSDITTAYVDIATGALSGFATGTAMITYTVPTGCYSTAMVTVVTAPAAISGLSAICVGAIDPLYDGVAGGVWSSSAGAIGSVDSVSGICAGLSAGVTTISYSTGVGCYVTMPVSVNALPLPIGGTARLCQGATTTLTDVTTGGSWSSGSPVASVSSGGVVTGVSGGTATISYTSGGSCAATRTVTVDPLPGPISGTLHVCQTATTTLGSITSGGVWASSNAAVATISSASGIVTGMSAGTATITHTVGNCWVTAVVTVNPLPAAITGTSSLCIGTSATLADAMAGGTWSRSGTALTIGAASGSVTGSAAGISLVTYTLPTGCYATRAETVTSSPAAISGPASVCVGAGASMSDITAGGTWSCSGGGIATINPATGSLLATGTGVAVVSYSVGTGCATSAVVTVNPVPAAIGGTSTLCAGSATVLSDATGSGSWSSSNTTIAPVRPVGVVAGMSAGTATISYTIPATGCYSRFVVTVNAMPAAISGPTAVCAGSTISLIDATAGGTWSSGSTGVATIGSTTGIVTGITTGAAMIWYTLPTGCKIATTINVSPAPSAISGPTSVCSGSSATLTTSSPGGVWSSSSAAATIGSLSGVAMGAGAGTAMITYSLGTGCTVSRTLTVVASPAAIGGPMTLCSGATATLSDATPGGAWSSSATTIATIGSTGLVGGVAAGTAAITYRVAGTGCAAAATITVNATPAAIGGPATVCTGATITETEATTGGVWSTTSPAITVSGSAGLTATITGIASGAAPVIYSIGSCMATRILTINAIAPVSGASGLCVGGSVPLTDASPGGAWSSSPVTVGSISPAGVVTGRTAGVVTIGYALPGGCTATKTVTVNAGPSAIGGRLYACPGGAATLTNSAGGGTWSSSTATIAAIGSLAGTVTAIGAGTATITYSLGVGCSTAAVFTVTAFPAAITGAGSLCVGATTSMSDATAGGAWSSGSTVVAAIAATGVASGMSTGTAIITYTLPTGCLTTRGVTVNPVPSPISGAGTVCSGGTTTLGSATPGGLWSSGSPAVAMTGSSSGSGTTVTVTGVATGIATITYAVSGCLTTKMITVSSLPPVTGPASLCAGSSATLLTAAGTGTWSSSNTAIATIGPASGVVTGMSAGTATITFTPAGGSGCSITRTETVNAVPPPISGPPAVCIGTTMTVSDGLSGGVWSSSNPVLASVGSASGVVSGLVMGVVTISYTIPTGCVAGLLVTVMPSPPVITGSGIVCAGSTTTLSDAATGGTWSSSSPAIATVGSLTGEVSGITGGSTTISYTAPTGCVLTRLVTVIAVPPLTHVRPLCAWGDTVTVFDANASGTYTSSMVTVINLGGGAGRLVATAPGITSVIYTLPSGCALTTPVVVNPLPVPITGNLHTCIGWTTVLSDVTAGGTWSSASPAIATAGSATGVVSGVAAGTARITYMITTTGCYTDTVVRVDPLPLPISAMSSVVIIGAPATFTDATAGGVWSSSNTAVATISASGVVTGRAAGTATISYTIPTGCAATRAITVEVLPGTHPAEDVWGSSINVAPNPNTGTFTISGLLQIHLPGTTATSNEEAITIELSNMVGQVVYRRQIQTTDGFIHERVQAGYDLPNGMYLLSLRSESGQHVSRVTVAR